jgi:CRP/FNR family cyclic AMP-dependent transcriptional regulator
MNPQDLKKIAVLKAVSDEALERLATVLEERRFGTGQVICAEGDPGDSMFFILEGWVSVEKKTSATGTSAKTLAVITAGDYFGEMSLFDQQPRSATTVAGGETRLALLPKAAFDELLERSNAAGLSVLFAMIRTSNDRIRRLSSQLIVYDEIGKAIGESRKLQELLDVVLNQLCQATFADWGLLLLRSQFSNELELRSVNGLELSAQQKELITTGKGFLEPMLKDPRDLVAKTFNEEEPFKSCSRFGFELPALLLSPILVENRLLGIIALGDHESGQFDLNDVHLVRGVARQAGQAILNAIHREEESARSRHSRQFVRF